MVKYTYDAWGNHAVEVFDTACSTLATLNPFRYRGYYYDADPELYYLNTRYYDPEIGRFMTIDGIEYLDPETINGLNLYAYCGNNPVMNVDPNGNFFLTFLLVSIGIGAAVGGIIAGITAYHSGSRGWDLFGSIAKGLFIGEIVGGIIGGLTAALIYAALAIGSFFGSAFQIGAYLTAAGELVAVTVTGAQIAAAGLAALAGMGIMFSKHRPGMTNKPPFSWVTQEEGIESMLQNNLDANKAADQIMNNHVDGWKRGAGQDHNVIKKWLDRIIRKLIKK